MRRPFFPGPASQIVTKIKAYGVTKHMSKWFEDFLSCRKQRVMIDEASSEWTDVSSGVPYGSVMRPLLFVIYINDLPYKIQNVTKLFADDSKIISVDFESKTMTDDCGNELEI